MSADRVTIVAHVIHSGKLRGSWELSGTYEIRFDGKPLGGAVADAIATYVISRKLQSQLPTDWGQLTSEDALKIWRLVWRWSDLPDADDASLATALQAHADRSIEQQGD